MTNKCIDNTLIIGCGDVGVRIARQIKARGGTVSGLARSVESAERLRNFGIEPIMGNLDDAESLKSLPLTGKLIYFLAPPPGGGPIDSRMRKFCENMSSENLPAKVVYMSTSGVYGDCGGDWVTEETPVNPQTSRAQRRVDAEKTLQEWSASNSIPHVILRVTGIYGPGRLPLARLQQGHPVLHEEESPPTNRIHADDLASVSVAAACAENGTIYNVSDGQPGTMTQYFNLVADMLDMPRPEQISMERAKEIMNPMMLSYLQETRRMNNKKMLAELDIVLQYLDLDSGLKNVLAQLDEPSMGYLGSVGH
jgi:nucleoside-diphosphate-sugar epimerase